MDNFVTHTGGAPPVVVGPTPTIDEIAAGTETDTPDGEAPSRPRRRRGGRGRESAERESRPDLEARGEEPLPLDEDSNPSIPSPPQAAVAYAEVVERMAPAATDLPVIALPAPARRHEPTEPVEAAAVRADEVDASEPTPAVKPAAPKPTPPVAPVDPSKASFSLLGWLKGGG